MTRPVVATLAVVMGIRVIVRNARAADVHGRHGLDRAVRRIVAEVPAGALIIGHGDGLIFGLCIALRDYGARTGCRRDAGGRLCPASEKDGV